MCGKGQDWMPKYCRVLHLQPLFHHFAVDGLFDGLNRLKKTRQGTEAAGSDKPCGPAEWVVSFDQNLMDARWGVGPGRTNGHLKRLTLASCLGWRVPAEAACGPSELAGRGMARTHRGFVLSRTGPV